MSVTLFILFLAESFCAKVLAGFPIRYTLFNQVTKSHVMNNVALAI